MKTCPFCGSDMHRGWIRNSGWYAARVATDFHSEDDRGSGTAVLDLRWFGRDKRNASCCPTCEALVVDPR